MLGNQVDCDLEPKTVFKVWTEDKGEMIRMLRSDDICSCLWDIKSDLRGMVKYYDPNDDTSEEYNSGYVDAMEKAYRTFHSQLEAHGIDLDEIWS